MNTVHIFDIDTTIADNTHRAELLKKICVVCLSPKPSGLAAPCPVCGIETRSNVAQSAWDLFFDPALVIRDTPVKKALKYANKLRTKGAEIHFLTGRSEVFRTVTELWLKNKFNRQKGEELIMRPEDEDGLLSSQYKERALGRFIKSRGFDNNVLFFFYEDDPHVLDMYSKHGIVIKCPEAWDYLMSETTQTEEKPFAIP